MEVKCTGIIRVGTSRFVLYIEVSFIRSVLKARTVHESRLSSIVRISYSIPPISKPTWYCFPSTMPGFTMRKAKWVLMREGRRSPGFELTTRQT